MKTLMRPESTYPRCETWQESVPAMGLTSFDHFQPGSNVALPTTCPPMLRILASPLFSKGRVSSGESKFLTMASAILILPLGPPLLVRSYADPGYCASDVAGESRDTKRGCAEILPGLRGHRRSVPGGPSSGHRVVSHRGE